MSRNNSKKTILLLADDIRHNSGISTASRLLVLGTIHHYNFINIGGSLKSPDSGKVFDLSDACKQINGRDDNYLKLYPVDGYGNEEILFQIISIEKPDIILHFTDPRYWGWLYNIENQVRAKIPLCYYTIWDDAPAPMWNKPFYKSCDALFSISKQTECLVKHTLGPEQCTSIYGDFDKNGKIINNTI